MSKTVDELPTLKQLPFPFYLQEDYTFENFYPGSNAIVINYLKAPLKQSNVPHALYVWGHRFVGCTHLLKACANASQISGKKAIYLSMTDAVNHYHSSDLMYLLEYKLVCLDDIEAIASYALWEESLFSLYNALTEQNIPIVLGSHQVPHQLSLNLPDLVSRLNSGLLFQVHELNDAEKISALQLRASLRGLELPETVAKFLLSRLPRNAQVLVNALNQLDLFALAKKRKLTITFVKEVLQI